MHTHSTAGVYYETKPKKASQTQVHTLTHYNVAWRGRHQPWKVWSHTPGHSESESRGRLRNWKNQERSSRDYFYCLIIKKTHHKTEDIKMASNTHTQSNKIHNANRRQKAWRRKPNHSHHTGSTRFSALCVCVWFTWGYFFLKVMHHRWIEKNPIWIKYGLSPLLVFTCFKVIFYLLVAIRTS